jgi:hypothetical protein
MKILWSFAIFLCRDRGMKQNAKQVLEELKFVPMKERKFRLEIFFAHRDNEQRQVQLKSGKPNKCKTKAT